MQANPFTPTFGTVPAILAGRDEILTAMTRAFEAGPGDPNLSTLLTGARGTGKTAMLSAIGDAAASRGWIAANTTAMDDMLEDLFEQATAAAGELISPRPRAAITSVSAGLLSASWSYTDSVPGNWRTRMNSLLDQVAEHGSGLLLTVDEVRADVGETSTLVTIYQHFVRERRPVALVMAGLPYHVHRLISNDSISFLRRARQHELGGIGDAMVKTAFRKTLEDAGGSIEQDALDLCVDAISGFPYMLQLVGYYAWIETGGKPIDVRHANRAIESSKRDMTEHVIAATVRELSDGDLRFARAMLDDEAESKLKDIADRMGVKSNYATKYKSRLLAQGVVQETARGVVSFAIPSLRDYLGKLD